MITKRVFLHLWKKGNQTLKETSVIKNVGIIGSGTMGSGIAQVAAAAGCLVTLFDVHQQALDTAKQSLEKITNRLVEKGRISSQEKDAIQNNIRYVNSLKDLAHSDLTIEAHS